MRDSDYAGPPARKKFAVEATSSGSINMAHGKSSSVINPATSSSINPAGSTLSAPISGSTADEITAITRDLAQELNDFVQTHPVKSDDDDDVDDLYYPEGPNGLLHVATEAIVDLQICICRRLREVSFN